MKNIYTQTTASEADVSPLNQISSVADTANIQIPENKYW